MRRICRFIGWLRFLPRSFLLLTSPQKRQPRLDLLLISIVRRLVEDRALHAVRQILLLYIMIGVIVGVLVVQPPSKSRRAAVMAVLRSSDLVFTAFMAASMALTAELLLGAQAT